MSTPFPTGGQAMQGLSAAIVYQAITKITDMLADADQQMIAAIQPNVENPLNVIPLRPEMMKASYQESQAEARDALEDANLEGDGLNVPTLPAILDQTIGTFFEDYTATLDRLFPGLRQAGESADAFVASALSSAMGVSYDELVDSTPADTAFLFARKQAFQTERDALDAAAAAGHRFAPGAVLDPLARMHADALAPAMQAMADGMKARLAQERSDKMRLIAAQLSENLGRIRKLHAQAAESFKLKLRARGMWVADQDAVIDADGQRYATDAQFNARVAELLRNVAARRHETTVLGYQAYDKDVDVGKIKISNGQEVVDLFGNMVTTLLNQIRANGSYQGSERDVTPDDFWS